MDRAKGVLAAMKYLAKQKKWKLEIDGAGARLKTTEWVDFDASYSLPCEIILAEISWGDKFTDLDPHR